MADAVSSETERLMRRAVALQREGNLREAERYYERVIELAPHYSDAYHNRSLIAERLGRPDFALALARKAVTIEDDVPELQQRLAQLLLQRGRLSEALKPLRRLTELKPEMGDAWLNLAVCYRESGQPERVLPCLRKALHQAPNNAVALHALGVELYETGNLTEAKKTFDRAIELEPGLISAHYFRAQIHHFREGDGEIRQLEALSAQLDRMPTENAAEILFALGKAYEDIGRYDSAFSAFSKGNRVKRRQLDFNMATPRSHFGRISQFFDGNIVESMAGNGDPSSVPIFIAGMPRSATTLVEAILAAHPDVYGAGEIGDFMETVQYFRGPRNQLDYPAEIGSFAPRDWRRLGERYVARLKSRDPGALRITNKTPMNVSFVGLMHLALPNAAIIRCVRNPMDTCLSCYTHLFRRGHGYTYDQQELGEYFGLYQDLMDHWERVLPEGRILTVSYERLVTDMESVAREIVAHCGLTWSDRCLEFHRSRWRVRTISAPQVRQRIYTSSVERWRRFEKHLEPLRQSLIRAGRWEGSDSLPGPRVNSDDPD